MIKVGFIEDDSIFLHRLISEIRLQPEILCLLSDNSFEGFWRKVQNKISLDILFVDLTLPGISGLEALPKLKKRFPYSELVVMTQIEDSEMLIKCLSNGATSYIVKDFQMSSLPSIIHMITKGQAIISPKVARGVVEFFHPKGHFDNPLSPKEEQLLKIFSMGYSYSEAAEMMGISENGIKYHVKNIYKKMGVKSKIEAIKVFSAFAENKNAQ